MVRIGDKIRLDIDGFDCTAIIVDLKAVSIPEQAGISNFDEEWYD